MLLGNQNNQIYNTNDINITQIFQILQKEKRWLTIHQSITITMCSNNNICTSLKVSLQQIYDLIKFKC